MKTWRKIAALLLIVIGAMMLMRGVQYTIARNLGWQGFVISSVAGLLVIALGIVRWRYWQRR